MHLGIARGVIAALAVMPTAAFAHTEAGATSGFIQGFAHPIGGIDHVLAMVAVGLLAFELGGRALWVVPAAFVSAMGLGGVLGAAGIPVPHVELGIALSIPVLGALVASRIRTPLALATTLAAGFAVFHGHAHGSEMPQESAALAYSAGFLLATAMLHVAGLGLAAIASSIGRAHGRLALRASGAAVTIAGVALVTVLL